MSHRDKKNEKGVWFFGAVAFLFFLLPGSLYAKSLTGFSLRALEHPLSQEKTETVSQNQKTTPVQASADLLPVVQNAESLKTYVDGEVLVKFKDSVLNLRGGHNGSRSFAFASSRNLEKKEDVPNNNISLFSSRKNTKGQRETVQQMMNRLQKDPSVESVQPNFLYETKSIATDDTFKNLLWGLDNTGQVVDSVTGIADADVDAPEAWAINEGTNASVIVAIIDTGVAYNHPDLIGSMWDGTNCVSDTNTVLGDCNHGYDFEDSDKTPLPTSNTHGTHLAGTIAAMKNNGKGIIGLAPNAKIMALKVDLTTSEIIKAINFAKFNGAKVINASWGGPDFDAAMKDAIDQFPGLFVAAAANSAQNNDLIHNYPSDYTSTNIISVAATDQLDHLASFSNYGAVSIDVGAPGVNIYSTVANSTVLDQTFEGVVSPNVPSGWTTAGEGSANWGVFGITSPDTYGFGSVLYGDKNVPYLNNADSTIALPAVDLGTAVQGAVLDFTSSCDTDFDPGLSSDYMQLEVSTDGTTWVPEGDLGKWNEDDSTVNYDEVAFDATRTFIHFSQQIPSAFLTAGFTLRFRWHTDASGVSDDGCSINNLQILTFSDGSDELYGFMDGTSMATPHVAALAALLGGFNPDLTSAQIKSAILSSGDALPALSGKTVSGKRINAARALQSVNPAKAITAFSFATPSVVGEINETDHTIALTVPFGTAVTALVPTIVTTGASVSPLSGVAQDFTSPVTYAVTAGNGSIQNYVVTVTIEVDPNIVLVAADKAALLESAIIGTNENVSHITTALTNPLPSTGLVNGSFITWASNHTSTISNDGQTIVRPPFADGDVTVTLTATITKGSASDTKIFTLTVLKLAASPISTVTSSAYTVTTGETHSETISAVPFAITKTNFLAALTKGESHEVWDSTFVTDPVVTGNVLVVTAQDGVTQDTYTITAALNPAKAIAAFNFASFSVTGSINETSHTITATVPAGTTVTALVPAIVITGASISPLNDVAQDFTNPVTYTVTAADASIQTYVVTVRVTASSGGGGSGGGGGGGGGGSIAPPPTPVVTTVPAKSTTLTSPVSIVSASTDADTLAGIKKDSEGHRDAPSTAEVGSSPFSQVVEPISNVQTGWLVRAKGSNSVYYVGADGKRHVFWNTQSYFSWSDSWNDVVWITDATLPTLAFGAPILPKQGVVLVKIASDPNVYKVESDLVTGAPYLRKITSEAIAIQMYGAHWADYVIDLEPTLFTHYAHGKDVVTAEVVDTSIMKTRAQIAALSL
ncbi:MAG: S8 family serine peptidase [Candidatus Uhrbacteria bacterium]|nr:S8 family serine peptidase [Candidatus Uhrbacteria bacterium]